MSDATVHLPSGTYLVSDTIGFRNFRVLAGESREKTIIQLKDGAPGLDDTKEPKPVVRCLFSNNQSIANDGSSYLRKIVASGYGTALCEPSEGVANKGFASPITEHLRGEAYALFGEASTSHLALPIADLAAAFIEPTSMWHVVHPVDGDATDAVQRAMDSGAATVCFIYGGAGYDIARTIRVPASVRRIVGMRTRVRGDEKTWPADQPLFRIEGRKGEPLTVEQLWPIVGEERGVSWAIASGRDVHLKAGNGHLRNTRDATGRLFITEMLGYLRLNFPQRV